MLQPQPHFLGGNMQVESCARDSRIFSPSRKISVVSSLVGLHIHPPTKNPRNLCGKFEGGKCSAREFCNRNRVCTRQRPVISHADEVNFRNEGATRGKQWKTWQAVQISFAKIFSGRSRFGRCCIHKRTSHFLPGCCEFPNSSTPASSKVPIA